MKIRTILLPFFLLLAGCGQPEPTPSDIPEPSALSPIFRSVPEDAVSGTIPELRKQATPGDDVVLTAKVMGTETPFVEGRALMVVGDEATLTSCDLMAEDDHCKTPWDTCCETRELILKGTATVQVVDESGKVLKTGFRGVNGLKELSRVRVKGSVAPMSTEQAMVINATAIEVLP